MFKYKLILLCGSTVHVVTPELYDKTGTITQAWFLKSQLLRLKKSSGGIFSLKMFLNFPA
jgi:hypothetical protein